MVFCPEHEIRAGVPFLVRWDKADGYDEADPETRDLKAPVFTGVTITAQVPQTVDPEGYYAAFIGTYGPVNIYTEAKTNLYLSADNTLHYPWAEGMTSFNVNACRAYFRLKNGLTAGNPQTGGGGSVREFILNFGEDLQGITGNKRDTMTDNRYYDLLGRKVNVNVNVKKGLYVVSGRKVVVK